MALGLAIQNTMAKSPEIEELKAFLQLQPAGPITDSSALYLKLYACWSSLDGGDKTSMSDDKLHRAEKLTWNPSHLEFCLERHGGTVHGSSRADLHLWRINPNRGTASIVKTSRRQLTPMAKRLDVGPIAQELVEIAVSSREHPWVKRLPNGRVKIQIGEVIPMTIQQTTAGRRKRLHHQLTLLLAQSGWVEVPNRSWVYEHKGPSPLPCTSA